jgi:hypothetical protein
MGIVTLRQRLVGAQKSLLEALENHARAGEQLAEPKAVAITANAVWVAQARSLLQFFGSGGETQRILNEKGWHATTLTDEDRARQVATDAAAIREVVAAVRKEPADFDHRIACAEIEQILLGFEATARRLAKRREGREPIAIADEYDVQYLLQALLSIPFHDVRTEEFASSVAGANSRIDFFIKQEHIAIEVKATRKGLDDDKLGAQLIEDLARYRGHPDIKTLYFFIWDPEHVIRNAAGIQCDLLREAGERRLRVIFSPPRR